MADVATPSGAAMFDGGAVEKKKVEKPEKPDEEVYKANLQKAEKAHQAAQAKFVCFTLPIMFGGIPVGNLHLYTDFIFTERS